MFDAVDGLEAEHAELESRLGEPEVHSDARLAKKLNQRYAELSRILAAKHEYDTLVADIGAARELAAEDPTFAAESDALAGRLQATEEQLRRLLVPRDPRTGRRRSGCPSPRCGRRPARPPASRARPRHWCAHDPATRSPARAAPGGRRPRT